MSFRIIKFLKNIWLKNGKKIIEFHAKILLWEYDRKWVWEKNNFDLIIVKKGTYFE